MTKNLPNSSKWIIYVSFLFSILALTVSLLYFLKNENIVYVDSMKVLSNYKGSIAAKAEYDKKVAVWKANIDTLTTELKNEISKYQKDKVKLTPREKKLTEEVISSKQQQLENYKAAISQNASKEDQEISSRVFKEIAGFLKRYGEARGYDFILASGNTGGIPYARSGKDITDEVVKALNSEFSQASR